MQAHVSIKNPGSEPDTMAISTLLYQPQRCFWRDSQLSIPEVPATVAYPAQRAVLDASRLAHVQSISSKSRLISARHLVRSRGRTQDCRYIFYSYSVCSACNLTTPLSALAFSIALACPARLSLLSEFAVTTQPLLISHSRISASRSKRTPEC